MRSTLAVFVTMLVTAGAVVAGEATAAPRAHEAQLTVYAAASLTRRLPEARPRGEVLVRRVERPRCPDHARCARRRVRLREHDLARAALCERALLQAGRLHAQPARHRRAEGEPGEHPRHLRPGEAGHQARHRGSRCARRELHAPDPEEHEPDECRARERRQQGDGRARSAREGRARRGGCGLRVLH